MKSRSFSIHLFTLVIFLIPLLLSCGSDDPNSSVGSLDFEVEESFSFAVSIVNHSSFRLEGISGNIEITGVSSNDTIKVEGERRVASESTEDAQEHLDLLQVQVTDLSNELYVKTNQPSDSQGRNYQVDYRITIPSTFAVITTNINGNVTASSLENTLSVGNTNGNVILQNISANTAINVTNGQILSNVTLQLDGTITHTVTNGNIGFIIPQNTSADFSASVVNGNISISNLDLLNQVTTAHSISGTLGGGRGTISLEVTNGNITASGT